jgi:3-hydroxybutyryl-CoA dehydrogenase
MEIRHVVVLGMGTMGSQIGIVCARAGFRTSMVETSEDLVQRGLKGIKAFLDSQVSKGKITEQRMKEAFQAISGTTDTERFLSTADLVIEAVSEDISLKKEVFKKADTTCPKDTILASNTSTLSISEMGAVTARPDKCIGTHFLIPAALTPLVEVVRGVETSNETHSIIINFLMKCGKQTVTVADSPGFVINRLYLPMVNEAFFALETSLASAEEIDRSCVKGLGFPLGPLAAADAFGLDVLLACINTLHRELGDKYRPAPLLVKLVKAGRLGKKAGRGVYDYDE